jgi:hypothetical protein
VLMPESYRLWQNLAKKGSPGGNGDFGMPAHWFVCGPAARSQVSTGIDVRATARIGLQRCATKCTRRCVSNPGSLGACASLRESGRTWSVPSRVPLCSFAHSSAWCRCAPPARSDRGCKLLRKFRAVGSAVGRSGWWQLWWQRWGIEGTGGDPPVQQSQQLVDYAGHYRGF